MINRLCQKQSLGIASGRVAGAGQWRSIHQSSYICPESRIISHLHYYPKYWNMIVKNDKYFVRSARTFYRAFDPVRPVPSATIFLLVLLFLSRHPWSPLPPVIPVVVLLLLLLLKSMNAWIQWLGFLTHFWITPLASWKRRLARVLVLNWNCARNGYISLTAISLVHVTTLAFQFHRTKVYICMRYIKHWIWYPVRQNFPV